MPKTTIDYTNTIIYKISCKDTSVKHVYVGHTTNFIQRKYAHKTGSIGKNADKCKLYEIIRAHGGWDNWKMEIVTHVKCKNHYEAIQREQDYCILLKATINDSGMLPLSSSLVNDETLPNHQNSYICCHCMTSYKYHSGLWRHKSICPYNHGNDSIENITLDIVSDIDADDENDSDNETNEKCIDTSSAENIIIHKNVVSLNKKTTKQLDNLTAENREMRMNMNIMMEMMRNNTQFQSQILETIKTSTTMNSNNTITNSHNNNSTFNMNMFLNEKCKDAMNMNEFVNSIQLNMTDMENMDRVGYVEGMSSIFIDNLQKTDLYKRPVHCSDIKRETLYVKENNKWEREGPDHAKMTKAVLAVEHKNVVLVNEWANANPRVLNSNTRENDKYFRLSKIVTDGDKEGNIAKVIRKVAKRVGIEKPATNMIEDTN
jgi:hypothetical protein